MTKTTKRNLPEVLVELANDRMVKDPTVLTLRDAIDLVLSDLHPVRMLAPLKLVGRFA